MKLCRFVESIEAIIIFFNFDDAYDYHNVFQLKLEEEDDEDDDEIKDMDEDVLDDELALPVSLIGNNDDDYINEC